MKTLLTLLLLLIGLRAAAAGPGPTARRRSANYEQEYAAPRPNPVLQRLARQRAAYLAGVLHLRPAQTHQLQYPIYVRLQELRWLDELAAPNAEVREEAARQEYYRQLTHILSPGQFAALLRLEDLSLAGHRLIATTRP